MYHCITERDLIDKNSGVATKTERDRLLYISDIVLLKNLAKRWCDKYGYRLGGYLGGKNHCFDATK